VVNMIDPSRISGCQDYSSTRRGVSVTHPSWTGHRQFSRRRAGLMSRPATALPGISGRHRVYWMPTPATFTAPTTEPTV
jgi:hypothetical protein